MTLEDLLNLPQFSLRQAEKERLLLRSLNDLTCHHAARCEEYARFLRVFQGGFAPARQIRDIPYLPVGIFKSHTLRSIEPNQVFRVLRSSGTTGQQPSQIYLDQETAQMQTIALGRIMGSILGKDRLPMIIIDSESILTDRRNFSARAAGVLGLMRFGRDHMFLLNESLDLQLPALYSFLEKHRGRPFLIFGFTYLVWAYFHERISTLGLDLSLGTLIHSGGWKALRDRSVSNDVFRSAFRSTTGLSRIYDFYGMAEQVGSIFIEGEDGLLYCPNFADVIIRDPQSGSEVPTGVPGLLQVVSLLPRSYPGHSLLTEDIGIVEHVDRGVGGRLGKAFRVLGRLPQAETRGCSDTHAPEVR